MQNAGYLFAAFAVLWVGLLGYVVVLFRREKGLQREIESLKEALKEKGAGR